jgi:hypothetical protein
MPNPNYMAYQTEIDWCVVEVSFDDEEGLTFKQERPNSIGRMADADPHALSHAARDPLDRRQHH